MLALSDWISDNLHLILGAAIVIVGLLVLGLGDLSRFSVKRIWAISSVNFAESIRRRVLWITPLAIIGVILVSQLQKPVDEADAIRQTVKFCLFAAGMVVTIVSIILASTNLPKEIENRVIYTVVTKPTTRLEIILGKILGFARVSAAILLIMGIFTWSYLHIRAWSMHRNVVQRLETGDYSPVNHATLEHYREAGLLSAKSFVYPVEMAVYSTPPKAGDDMRWIYGSNEQDILIPFRINPGDLYPSGMSPIDPAVPPATVAVRLDYRQRNLTPEELQQSGGPGVDINAELPTPGMGPVLHPAAPSNREQTNAPPPRVNLELLDSNRNTILSGDKGGGTGLVVPADTHQPLILRIPTSEFPALEKSGVVYLQVVPLTNATQYGARIASTTDDSPAAIIVGNGNPPGRILFPTDPKTGGLGKPIFRGRAGIWGEQLRGGPIGQTPVGVFSFRSAALNPNDNGKVGFEFKSGIERSGSDDAIGDDLTVIDVSALDPQTRAVLATTTIQPENARNAYFELPASSLNNGNFDLLFQNKTAGHWVGLKMNELALVTSDSLFGYNLLKSMFILWLMSILVITIAICCSTLVSWPTAIVLTLIILFAHWGVVQLGDSLESGVGNRVVQDLGFKDAAQAKVISTSVEFLSKVMNTVSNFLPDISRFEASEDVERGVLIDRQRLLEALKIAIGFGLPIMVLAYIRFKNVEVAP